MRTQSHCVLRRLRTLPKPERGVYLIPKDTEPALGHTPRVHRACVYDGVSAQDPQVLRMVAQPNPEQEQVPWLDGLGVNLVAYAAQVYVQR